jgi:hypothetical protein
MANLSGAKVKLGTEDVTLLFSMGAVRKANAAFPGRTVDKLIEAVQAADINVIVTLAACGLSHLKTYDDMRVENCLEAHPEQTTQLAAAIIVALSEGFVRIMSKEHREKLGEEHAAALRAKQPPAAAAEGSGSTTAGPTSTSPSAPADGSGSPPT